MATTETAKPTESPAQTNTSVQPTAPAQATAAATTVDVNKTYTVSGADYKVSGDDTVSFTAVKKKVKSVKIPDTVTIEGKAYKVTAVAANAFKNCKKLKSVTIGKNVKRIGAKAFYGCKLLKKVTVKSASLKTVGKAAFKKTAARLVIKVPSKKAAVYKKMFKGKGQSKKAKIK